LLRGLQSAASSLLRAAPTNRRDGSHAREDIVVRTCPDQRGMGIYLWLRMAPLEAAIPASEIKIGEARLLPFADHCARAFKAV
jgi:hypothetical protein